MRLGQDVSCRISNMNGLEIQAMSIRTSTAELLARQPQLFASVPLTLVLCEAHGGAGGTALLQSDITATTLVTNAAR